MRIKGDVEMSFIANMIFLCDGISTAAAVTAAVASVFVGVMSFVFAVRLDE